jgi:flavodoxin
MKILVVYYSRTGNTKKAGEAIAKSLKCDSEEIIDKKARKGPLGFLSAGRDATKKNLAEIAPLQKNPSKYGMVIIGTPNWNKNMSCATRTYISQNKERFKKVAFFCTAGGGSNSGIFRDMEEMCGKSPKATLELAAKEVANGEHLRKVHEFAKKLQRN